VSKSGELKYYQPAKKQIYKRWCVLQGMPYPSVPTLLLYDSEKAMKNGKPVLDNVRLAYGMLVEPMGKKMGKAFCIHLGIAGRNEAFWAKDAPVQTAWIEALKEATKKPPASLVLADGRNASTNNSNQEIKINLVTPGGAVPGGGMDPMLAYQQQQMLQQQYQQQLYQSQLMMQQQYQAQLNAQNAAYQQQLAQLSQPSLVPVGGMAATSSSQSLYPSAYPAATGASSLNTYTANPAAGMYGQPAAPGPAMYGQPAAALPPMGAGYATTPGYTSSNVAGVTQQLSMTRITENGAPPQTPSMYGPSAGVPPPPASPFAASAAYPPTPAAAPMGSGTQYGGAW